jgi:hypothetical protein
MTPPRDRLDPDHPPPIVDPVTDEDMPGQEVDLADLLASRDATDGEVEFRGREW